MFNLLSAFEMPSMDFAGITSSVLESSGGAIAAGLGLFAIVIGVKYGKKLFNAAK